MKKRSIAIAAVIAATTTAAVVIPNVTASTNPFTDVPDTNSHKKAIIEMYNAGIVEGRTTTTYVPNANATRGEAAYYLAKALGLDMKNVQDPGFKDVPKTSKYYGAIAALHTLKIVGGYDDGTFKPDGYLTRKHMAKMLVMSYELQPAQTTSIQFEDVGRLTEEEKLQIKTLLDYGITQGQTKTTFGPYKNLTRAQLATFLYNAKNALQEDFVVISVE